MTLRRLVVVEHPLGPSTGGAAVVRAEWGRLRMDLALGG